MKKILILIFIVAVAGGLYWYVSQKGGIDALSNQTASTSAETGANAAGSAERVEYSDQEFRFKLSYPKDFEVHVYNEDDGSRTVAFEGPSLGEAFQVFVTPYAEKIITSERFKKDQPSGVMQDPQDIIVDGAAAKVFTGHNDQMGDTREVWMIHEGFLYEITTYKALDSWLAEIVSTWKFI